MLSTVAAKRQVEVVTSTKSRAESMLVLLKKKLCFGFAKWYAGEEDVP